MRTRARSGCVLWLRGRTAGGYGKKKIQGKWWAIHRLSWTLVNGPISRGFCVLHRCDVPACFNIDHLFLGTHAENMADMVSKARGPLGARNARTKLTESQVAVIRKDPRGCSEIAGDYGVSRQHVSRIRSGIRRRH